MGDPSRGERVPVSSVTLHERFLELFALMAERDRDIARAFDGPRRSTMILQLSLMRHLGLLEADELDRFSSSTREMIKALGELS